ncbi:hypothetical protein ABI125_03415 [Tamlana crocina]
MFDSYVFVFNKKDWNEMIDFMTDGTVKLEQTFNKTIQKINQNQREIDIIKNIGSSI